ncbi:hypothetical protein K502DRAFT_345270 [Neoconidiobolus thromboides FSU 785]|nr:hypothetical protein K502DRAFT_345270 [Neoconidiobolus thromboides FSU 785]
MLISHSGLIFSQAAYDLAGINSHELAIYSYITGGLLGTLNFIAFCCDPTIQHALKIIYYRVVKKREIEMFQPNKSSYNDAFESKEAENNDKASKFDSETVDQKAIQYHKFIRTL